MMVPIEMTEVFAISGGRGEGRATYSNFRRFGTERADRPSAMKLVSVLLVGTLAAQAAGLDTVLERLDAYLDQYETELSAVVADEELIQETDGRLNRRMSQRLQSEIAFLRLPGGLEWMGFRRVDRQWKASDRYQDAGGAAGDHEHRCAAAGRHARRRKR